ncbi:G-protein coupled receptor 126-like [Sinocyclocheilus grahami]|uniref:G-protein coupled receptor 126-like n=1 Tax=Sinocyclocheilus grahami TaxID=75366 RepID=UPI0007AC5325|nr:PREDICTED: G-protein coupled receptor 126-like [Sinocyclocheilus grahami]
MITSQNINFSFHILTVDQTPSKCIVVHCLPDGISKLLKMKETQMNMPQDMRNILNIKAMCKDVIFSEIVVDTYIRVERKAIHNIINMNISEQSKNYYHEDLSMIVVKMNLNTTDDFVPIVAPSVLHLDKVADIQIPVEPFKIGSQTKIGIVTYDSDQHFKLKVRNKNFTSKVIRIEVPGCDIKNLNNPLKIKFKLNYTETTSDYNLSCQFYDENGNGSWITDGCLTNNTSDVVECSCDHMTPFAVLLVSTEPFIQAITKRHWEILSYISYVGCGLSAFFSASTVLSFIFSSNARAEVSNSIHVSLSGALFLLNLSFMLIEWAATLTVKEVCVFIAVTLHYSLLCSFTWMAIEALHLYLLLIRVFNIYIRHYMVKLSLIGWGVPAVIVGGLLSANNIYGIKEMALSDTNTTNQICWIRDPHVLYGVNIFYFSIIFLFNLGILVTVSRQIFKLRHVGNRHGKMPVWKDAGTVLGLMCLQGTTWGLIFFSSGYINYPILYLFCILNSMQGFYIFVWMCASTRKNRAQTPHSKSKSTLDTSK